MKPSKRCADLIREYEKCKLVAYLDAVKIWTIGWGNTRYIDGTKVKEGDKITKEQAEAIFQHHLTQFGEGVDAVVKQVINQDQFDALVSFAYNVGLGNFGTSSLLKKVKKNPNDPTIEAEFLRWNKGRNPETKKLEVLNGLTKRRQSEADLYFGKI